ncbi:MAG: nitrile hydratase subunit alpha, partial [Actinomycetota bacterium]|nr:nitrile hydratase subunit alpha [Actinomycetota bacterium]
MSTSHDHAPIQEAEEVSEFEVLETAIRELSISRGLFSAEDHRRFTEWADSIGPAGGSRLVAKAWV